MNIQKFEFGIPLIIFLFAACVLFSAGVFMGGCENHSDSGSVDTSVQDSTASSQDPSVQEPSVQEPQATSTVWYSAGRNIVVLSPFALETPFDVDSDGIVDFVFYSSDLSAELRPQGNNAATGPLASGLLIDVATEGWFEDRQTMVSWMGLYEGDLVASGPWANVTGYMGLKFVINDNVHYGWAQIAGGATLLGWAYETRPGVGIKAGQTE